MKKTESKNLYKPFLNAKNNNKENKFTKKANLPPKFPKVFNVPGNVIKKRGRNITKDKIFQNPPVKKEKTQEEYLPKTIINDIPYLSTDCIFKKQFTRKEI